MRMILIRAIALLMLINQTTQSTSYYTALIAGRKRAGKRVADFVVCTQSERWVIPLNCEVLKALLYQQQLKAADLQFSSKRQCQGFIHKLLLLAAQDECLNQSPSSLATLARELINQQCQSIHGQPSRIIKC